MILLDKFVKKILKENETSSFGIVEGNRFYNFIQTSIGKARYVYGAYGLSNEYFYSNLDEQYKLVAIVSDGIVYVVDRYFFHIYYSDDDTVAPETVRYLSDFRKELNQYVIDSVFPKFYEEVSTDGISEKDIYTDCKQVAREYRLSGGWIEGQIMGDLLESLTMLLTMQDAADILCGIRTKDELALKRLKEIKDWGVRKATVEKVKEYTKDPNLVEDWEVAMAKGIIPFGAKTIRVEFELNGKVASGKMEPLTVVRALELKNNFIDCDFIPGSHGIEVMRSLGASISRGDKCSLTCKNIRKITYGRKVWYVRKMKN